MDMLLRADEVASILKVSVRAVYRWAATNELQCVRLAGTSVRFRPCDVESFIERSQGRRS